MHQQNRRSGAGFTEGYRGMQSTVRRHEPRRPRAIVRTRVGKYGRRSCVRQTTFDQVSIEEAIVGSIAVRVEVDVGERAAVVVL